MPIRPENRHRYPPDWKAISLRIRKERAKDRCEQCGAPNGQIIARGMYEHEGYYMLERGDVYDANTGERVGIARGSEFPANYIKVVLTVAHLDHTPENCADDNLKALCQRCHNRYDAATRRRGMAERARAQKAAGDLFRP